MTADQKCELSPALANGTTKATALATALIEVDRLRCRLVEADRAGARLQSEVDRLRVVLSAQEQISRSALDGWGFAWEQERQARQEAARLGRELATALEPWPEEAVVALVPPLVP